MESREIQRNVSGSESNADGRDPAARGGIERSSLWFGPLAPVFGGEGAGEDIETHINDLPHPRRSAVAVPAGYDVISH